jgi:beta-lactamase class A
MTAGRVITGRLIFTGLLLATAVAGTAAPKDRLTAEIERHGEALGVTIGLSATHLATGAAVSVNGSQRFPLASTYKVPMAAYALHLVEKGELNLDQLIEVLPSDLVVSSSITRLFPHPGIRLSLLNLMEATLISSDNTATDVLLRTIGGGEAVTGWLRDRGIRDLRVDRSTADLIREYMNMPPPPEGVSMASQYQDANFDDFTDSDWEQFYRKLLADPRDQGTPDAMATLLKGLWEDAYLEARHGQVLREIMARCFTGASRLTDGLPLQQLPVAHKTGTLGGTVNDAGVMTLPDGSQVVIVVFTRGRSTLDVENGERAIAEVGRTVYDYFLFQSEPESGDGES